MATESQALVFTHSPDEEVAALFELWRKPLTRYLLCCGASQDEASDVVQDAFLRLHQHVLGGGSRENLRAWVFRVAHNAAVNGRLSAARRLASPEAGGSADPVSAAENPEQIFLKKERLLRLHSAMKELSPVARGCVLLRSEGLRYREIGAVLEIGVSTVADHLDRALRKLGDRCNV